MYDKEINGRKLKSLSIVKNLRPLGLTKFRVALALQLKSLGDSKMTEDSVSLYVT